MKKLTKLVVSLTIIFSIVFAEMCTAYIIYTMSTLPSVEPFINIIIITGIIMGQILIILLVVFLYLNHREIDNEL